MMGPHQNPIEIHKRYRKEALMILTEKCPKSSILELHLHFLQKVETSQNWESSPKNRIDHSQTAKKDGNTLLKEHIGRQFPMSPSLLHDGGLTSKGYESGSGGGGCFCFNKRRNRRGKVLVIGGSTCTMLEDLQVIGGRFSEIGIINN
ncbi:unnamed protein product [Lactuca saligna]|uniref:Uncharacterized protein n=1 Tax=Lactuca saligna TaxID=75948 RepID=A0AA35ZJI1_LACSI|nr:unnamed protein product [Lactuca saligna]